MPGDVDLPAAFALGVAATGILTPLAIRLAHRTVFYDHPHSYKAHTAPTPYLGGAAVVAGFLVAGLIVGSGLSGYWPIVVGTLGLWLLGTLDDRRSVPPGVRVGGELAAAALLVATGLGWSIGAGGELDAVVSALWVVAVVNSFNLMDNMDGVGGLVAAASCSGIAALALAEGDHGVAVLALGLGGACLGFIPYNLRSPARIFLGDGGSMPIGFVVAATSMALSHHASTEWRGVVIAVLLIGVPLLDTALVIVSRGRRRVSMFSGGTDHLSHRLRRRLPSAGRVAATLAALQLGLAVIAVAATELRRGALASVAMLYVALAAATIAVLERPGGAKVQPRADS